MDISSIMNICGNAFAKPTSSKGSRWHSDNVFVIAMSRYNSNDVEKNWDNALKDCPFVRGSKINRYVTICRRSSTRSQQFPRPHLTYQVKELLALRCSDSLKKSPPKDLNMIRKLKAEFTTLSKARQYQSSAFKVTTRPLLV